MANPLLLEQFGLRPQPIVRAVGLRWPDAAREIVKQRLADVASDQFDPSTADPTDLATYSRALAALQQWLDPTVAEVAMRKLASGINGLTLQRELTDKQLRAIVETVAVFGARLDPAAIEPARDRLRREIGASPPTDPSSRRARVIGRAIEIMSPILTTEERRHAARYLVPLLGQNIDSWSAKATPRAMAALLPTLDPGQASEAVRAIPPAIAIAAVSKSDQNSAYLLALMQVVEMIARTGDQAAAAAFGQALEVEIANRNEPFQRAALARAALPLLERNGASATVLLATVVATTLAAEETRGGTDPAHRDAMADAEATLRGVLAAPDDAHIEGQSAALLQLLHRDLGTKSTPNSQSNPYRHAAQARLLEMLAPSMTEKDAALAAADLLDLLARTEDYLAREAIARALAGLAPKLPATERAQALPAAKLALAKTGSAEEATAWARAIAALLPAEPSAATTEIVEALKYPTATEAPSDVLVAALAHVWPEEYKAIAGRTLPDPIVLDWLEQRLPTDQRLTDPPRRPAGLKLAGAALPPR